MPNAPMTWGMATLVIELVKIDVKNADIAAAVASHRAAGVKPASVELMTAVVTGAAAGTSWARSLHCQESFKMPTAKYPLFRVNSHVFP